MHKANTYDDEEQTYSSENSISHHIEQPPTENEQRALHFFETGLKTKSIPFFLLKKIFSSR